MIKPRPKNQDGIEYGKNKSENTLLLIRRKGFIHGLYLCNDRLMRISSDSESSESLEGMICVAKVMDVVENIGAVFVRLANGVRCFVHMKDIFPVCNLSGRRSGCVQGDNLLIQITKDASKGKEAGGTTRIHVEGESCVLMPGTGVVRLSKQLDAKEKQMLEPLRQQLVNLASDRFDFVLRTAAKDCETSVVLGEAESLVREWEALYARAITRTDYSVLKTPVKQYEKLISEIENSDVRVLSDDRLLYNSAINYIEQIGVGERFSCHFYEDRLVSLSVLFGVEGKLAEALSDKVWLKSGGFLYIEQTQAMVVIDVNSGKYDKKIPKEDAYYRVNMEAAEEIARQITLRNLSGIIIVDFINMNLQCNRENLVNFLRKLFQNDRNSATIVDITKLGLLEITRKKTGKTIYEQIFM